MSGKTQSFNEVFRKFAQASSRVAGSPWAFSSAVIIIVLWGISGPFFGFSDTWQLIINTSTTIVTFLIVFLIQNTQNRESKAVQLKLDELIKSTQKARNGMINLEELSDEELDSLHTQFKKLRKQNRSDTEGA
jgi:low affinity Fe/Cu permease